jgi:hypothetical protein
MVILPLLSGYYIAFFIPAKITHPSLDALDGLFDNLEPTLRFMRWVGSLTI